MGGRHANVVGTVPDGARACRTEFALAHTLKKEPPRRTSKVWRSRKHFVGEEMWQKPVLYRVVNRVVNRVVTVTVAF